jgi:uncharacterized protein YeaO (DUF488 family)
MSQVRIRRVYALPSAHRGRRILVDRVWPRGVSRQDLGALLRQGPLTLLYDARDEEHDQAVALCEYLRRGRE